MKPGKRTALAAAFACGLLATAFANALVISSPATDAIEVDGNSGTPAISTIAIATGDLGTSLDKIVDISVTVDFMKCAGNFGTLSPLPVACPAGDAYAREIRFVLTGPGGIATLVDFDTYFPGDSGPNPGSHIVVTFKDDPFSPPVDLYPDVGGTDFSTGTFNPVTVLPFIGTGAVGAWTLSIEDDTALAPLAFASFTLNITLADAQVPVPATALLLGLGLAGLAVSRRRLH